MTIHEWCDMTNSKSFPRHVLAHPSKQQRPLSGQSQSGSPERRFDKSFNLKHLLKNGQQNRTFLPTDQQLDLALPH